MNNQLERTQNQKEENPKNLRKFLINNDHDGEKDKSKFPDNRIKTAKYNAFTFLPLAITYQFNNYFNIFFLITAIITSIPQISTINPGAAIGPFLFVIVVSLIREAIEDVKKTKFDNFSNKSPTFLWNRKSKEFSNNKWADIYVGDIIRIDKNQTIPSDVLVLKSSKENGFCYLETTNLDGESALKPREAIIVANSLIKTESDLNLIEGYAEVEQPNNDIYTVEGTLFLKGYERCNFDINNVLLRGGRLKNVEYVYALAIYTGRDSKIMKNIKHYSLKYSSIDRTLNKIVIYISILVLLLCIICTILGGLWRSTNMPNYTLHLLKYDYVLYYNKKSGMFDDTLELIRIFASYFITYNTLIPISLMITYQILKGLQILVIQGDPLLSEGDDKIKALTMTLHEDLGMVKYILTDKTGTLTLNEMKFYACSIFCKLFDQDDGKDEAEENEIDYESEENLELMQRDLNVIRDHEREKHRKNTENPDLYENISIDKNQLRTENKPIQLKNNINKNNQYTTENTTQPAEPIFKSSISASLDKTKIIQSFHQHNSLRKSYKNPPFDSLHEAVLEFFLNISLNHNVLTETDHKTGELLYQGVNPDEVALVRSAAEFGVEFINRQSNIITLKIFDKFESFEVIQKFDFTSVRMRSSIIVKDSSGRMKLYMKGADTKILEKLNQFSIENLREKSRNHLDAFAKRGLRTLCYSFKIINEEYFHQWESVYKDIKYQSINNKALLGQLETIISNLEDDMILLGVSALEDKLQDCVKEDLKSFIDAGISVWMLTGDKMDTAESIGYSCKLFNKDTEVFKIKKGTKEETRKRLNEILEKMAFTEKELEEYKNKNSHENEILHNNNLQIKKDLDIGKCYIKSKSIRRDENIANNKHEEIGLRQEDVQIQFVDKKNETNEPKTFNINLLNNFKLDNYKKDQQITRTPGPNLKTNVNNKKKHPIYNNQKNMYSTHQIPIDTRNNILPDDKSSLLEINQHDDNDIIDFMKDKSYYKYTPTREMDNFSELKKKINGEVTEVLNDENIVVKFDKGNNKITLKSNQANPPNQLCKTVFNPSINNNCDFARNPQDIPDRLYFYEQQLNQLDKDKKKIIPNISFKKSKKQNKKVLINFGLIIEGESISHCLTGDEIELFWQLIKKSKSVIACRCSPFQKAQLVSFIKKQSNDITLAIGDGGNDVNMIKTANVGVGIFGKEGYQAAYNSDFAISQFKYLKRLIFVHGRYSLERNSYYSYFYFFKNVLFSFPQLWLMFYSGFSGLNYYDDWYYMGYNSFLTVLPIACRTLMNEDIDMDPKDPQNKQIIKTFTPDIYNEYRESTPFSLIKFFLVYMSALVYSVVVFFIPLAVFNLAISNEAGTTFSFYDHSLCSFLAIIAIHFLTIIEDTHLWTWLTTLAYSLQFVVIIIFMVGNDLAESGQISGGITLDILANLLFWLTFLLSCAICIIPFYIFRRINLHFSKEIIKNIRQKKYEYNFIKKSLANKLEEVTKNIRHIVKFKKILHGDNIEYDNYANKKVKELVDLYQDKRKNTIKSIKKVKRRNMSDSNLNRVRTEDEIEMMKKSN